MTRAGVRRAIAAACNDLLRHHCFQAAAALSYYFVLAIFPGLILLSAVMRSFPLPDLFGHVLGLMAQILPPDTMHTVRAVLLSTLGSQHTAWISIGMLGILWVTSAAFDALIEALDIAYDVNDPRPLWKTRLIAIGLGVVSWALLTTALSVMILGPRFGQWLANHMLISRAFVVLWPIAHWSVAVGFTVLTVEFLYFLAPNVKQRFLATLPGAVFAVAFWIGFSYLLGLYFRNFASYDRIYGTLGGLMIFMTWLYWTSLALVAGAELNAELAKESRKGAIPAKVQSDESATERENLRSAA